MSPGRLRLRRIIFVVIYMGLGFCLGMSVLTLVPVTSFGPSLQSRPAAFTEPAWQGAMPLRLAMVHDILHERYPRHSKDWYRYRLQHPPATLVSALDAYDDKAMALDRLGRSTEALQVLADKAAQLPEQPALTEPLPSILGLQFARIVAAAQYVADRNGAVLATVEGQQRDQYRLLANRGTVLAHQALRGLATTSKTADLLPMLQAAQADIIAAVELNPRAHFGRELWQALAIGHIEAACRDPRHLQQFTMTGQKLLAADASFSRSFTARYIPGGNRRAAVGTVALDAEWCQRVGLSTQVASRHESDLLNLNREPVGDAGEDLVVSFDLPVLGLIGMWYMGGGPNPHSALALAQILERCGQRWLAWMAYERCISMSDRFWPKPDLGPWLVSYAQSRQHVLAQALTEPIAQLRASHQQELQRGRHWQDARMDYERQALAAGTDPMADDFFRAFVARHGRIASQPGPEDLVYFGGSPQARMQLRVGLSLIVAAVCGLAALLSLRRRERSATRA